MTMPVCDDDSHEEPDHDDEDHTDHGDEDHTDDEATTASNGAADLTAVGAGLFGVGLMMMA